MRPRGLSSSSPSSRKVGQVAVQKPQWTQVRSTWLEAAVSGSRSCSAVKLVCIGQPWVRCRRSSSPATASQISASGKHTSDTTG